MSDHKFWNTQPVQSADMSADKGADKSADKSADKNEAIVEDAKFEIKQEPYTLPAGFNWISLDLQQERDQKMLYEFLRDNYGEDDDGMFRFNYSIPFLCWALMPLNYNKNWHVGVVTGNNKLVGFISGIPHTIIIRGITKPVLQINFLCVDKNLRDKRLTPVLIKEISRRGVLEKYFQAVYTVGKLLPGCVSTARYYNRLLNPKKLIENKFSNLPHNASMSSVIKLYRLSKKPYINMCALTEDKCGEAYLLFNQYLNKLDIAPVYNLEQFKYWFLPRENIIYTFIVEDAEGAKNAEKRITDMISFFIIDLKCLFNNATIKTAYAYYNIYGKNTFEELMENALILANNLECDVYNCLDIMDHTISVFKNLKFKPSDSNLYYYLYNWQTSTIEPRNNGITLL